MRTALYEVKPMGVGWLIRIPNDSVEEIHRDKPAAIRRARDLGSHYDAWCIRVLDANGNVEKEIVSPTVKKS